jgi:hypothetical protein
MDIIFVLGSSKIYGIPRPEETKESLSGNSAV